MPHPQLFQCVLLVAMNPSSWIRTQMTHTFVHGIVGHLNKLVLDLIQRDDIYGAYGLTKTAKTRELGVVAKESLWEVQFLLLDMITCIINDRS